MKLITFFLSVFVVKAYGFLIKVPVSPKTTLIPNTDWIHRQKIILSFFNNVCDPSLDPMIVRLSKEFNFDTITGNYKNPEVLENLRNLVTGKGLLPKGVIFTEYNKEHLHELQIVSSVLCDAEDFDTFLKTAAWARQNINCGLFVDALYLAVIKRRDTEKLSIPAPYELLPNYFIQKDHIITGSSLLAGIPISSTENVRVDGNSYVIDANYTSDIFDNDDESKLSYFHEDIGLNSYYFFRKLTKVPWFNDLNKEESRYGEFLYHMMKQLATRYDLERYANGFEEVSGINWDNFDSFKYDSMLIYSNGNNFGFRRKSIDAIAEEITILKNIEENIVTVISHMRQSGYDKSMILNNLMEILVTGDKNYDTLAHALLERSTDFIGSPTALEHYMTSVRDPLFWRLNKKIVNLIETALNNLPTYAKNELYFPGVEIVNVDIKKMTTFCENFEFDVTDALRDPNSDSAFQVKISQLRLNHKSFTVKVNISSLVTQKGLLKIYLGPKILPGELALKKNKFMLLDAFEVSLKKGSNIISRSSEEITNLSPDFVSLKTLYKNVDDAEFGLGTLSLENIEKLINFPSRLIIPKGLPDGLPVQVFVFVAPFVKVSMDGQGLTSMEFNSAIMSPGYPLDLNIENWQLFDLPNVLVKEIIVTHKETSKGGNYGGKGEESEKWDGGSSSYDYSAKKGQYGKKTDNTVKRWENKPYYQELNLMEKKDYKTQEKTKETVKEIDLSEVNDDKTFNKMVWKNEKQEEENNNFKIDSNKKNKNDFHLTGDFIDDIDKKIDESIYSIFNPKNIIRPLLKSTKTFDKYKKVNKSENIINKNINTEIKKPIIYSSNNSVIGDSGQWSKTIMKDDSKNEVNPDFYSTNMIEDKKIDQWTKSITKNNTKSIIIKPIVPTDVSLDTKDAQWSKKISSNTKPEEVNKSFFQSADVTIDNNGAQWSKTIRKIDPKDLKEPLIHTTFAYNDETVTKTVNKEDRPALYDYFLHGYFDNDEPVYE